MSSVSNCAHRYSLKQTTSQPEYEESLSQKGSFSKVKSRKELKKTKNEPLQLHGKCYKAKE
jgi:hypothetical protein